MKLFEEAPKPVTTPTSVVKSRIILMVSDLSGLGTLDRGENWRSSEREKCLTD
jgi:hypothetical protein